MRMLRALLSTINAKSGGQPTRYLAVVIGGFLVDFSIGLTTPEVFGLNLMAAAALGFLVAMSLSYFAHEFWTFRSRDSGYSHTRLAKFAGASGFTLGTRVVLVWLSTPLQSLPFGSLMSLLFAFGGSLVVGFLVNRFLVFSTRAETAE